MAGSQKPTYTEVELCREFAAFARDHGYDAYPETGGWDLLLVAKLGASHLIDGRALPVGLVAGFQIGVQAKLAGNLDVLAQTLALQAPINRMILVGRASKRFKQVARALKLTFAVREYRMRGWSRIGSTPAWQRYNAGYQIEGSLLDTPIGPVCVLPPIVPDLPGGGAAPRQLTPWRMKAFKLVKILKTRGHLSNVDFKSAGVDKRRWLASHWLNEIGGVMIPGLNLETGLLKGYEKVYNDLDQGGHL